MKLLLIALIPILGYTNEGIPNCEDTYYAETTATVCVRDKQICRIVNKDGYTVYYCKERE